MSQEFWNVFSGDDFNFFHQTLGVCISRWRSCFESYFGAVFFCRWEHVGTLKNISLTIPLFFLQIVSPGHVFRLLGQNQLWSLRDLTVNQHAPLDQSILGDLGRIIPGRVHGYRVFFSAW